MYRPCPKRLAWRRPRFAHGLAASAQRRHRKAEPDDRAARWRTIAVRPQYVGPGAAGSSCHRPNSLPSGISTFTGCPAMSPHPGRRSDRPRSCPHSLMRRRRHLVRSRSCSSRSSASRDRTSALSASITMLLATSTSPPAAAASLSPSTRRASAPDARYRTPGAGSRGEFLSLPLLIAGTGRS